MFERYAFVAITTRDLDRAREFWVHALGFTVTEEQPGQFFMVDAGGLRLCVDLEDDDTHKTGGSDPVIGLKAHSLEEVLQALERRGIEPERGPVAGPRGAYAHIRDPDGHMIILTEAD